MIKYWIIGLLSVVILSCNNKHKVDTDHLQPVWMEYARQISIDTCPSFALVKVRNPWDTTELLHTYVLVDRDRKLPDSLPQGTIVRVPLCKALVYTSVHCALMIELGAIDRIGGVCDLQYINLPEIQERCASGQMIDVGNSMNPDMEKIIDFHPDAILLSPFENSGGYGRIEKLGVPVIECADYMETSPLGRAEWMRFFGMLFGCTPESDSLFRKVAEEYLRLKGLVRETGKRPTVISELKSGSAWYVPGGKSTIGLLYQDAGGAYLWAEDLHSGSVPLAFETVYDRGHGADFWLIKYNQPEDKTLAELKTEYAPYAGFKAFQTGAVYGCNTGKIPFYEETPFHPEMLLKDLIRIFHPEVMESGECRYFKKLNQ